MDDPETVPRSEGKVAAWLGWRLGWELRYYIRNGLFEHRGKLLKL
jgi:hypothetical protein